MSDSTEPKQSREHLFKPGQSGNPKGRPPGSGLSAQLRASIAEDLPEILRALATNAKAGDASAARVLLDKVLPSLRAEASPVEVCGMSSGSLTERAEAAVSAVGRGELSPDSAASILTSLASLARIKESEEFEARLRALEERLGEKR